MEYTEASDKQLWERCLTSDEGAYSEIFRRHSPQMLRIATRYVKDSMVAEELVMDCFFHLWTKRGQIIEGNFLNYLFQSVRNSVISNYRKEIQATIRLEQMENKLQTDCESDSHLISDDLQRIYCHALQKLTPRRRQVFLMSRRDNLSYVEIAQRMNVSESAVDNYISAALAGLRANMKAILSITALLFFPTLL